MSYLLKILKFGGFLGGSLFLLLFQNCSKIDTLQNLEKQSVSQAPPNYQSNVSQIKPALAVRAGACVACHGIIHGDMITDFGLGEPYFFGRGTHHLFAGTSDVAANSGNSFYGTWPTAPSGSYSTLYLDQGSFIVPKTRLSQTLDGSSLNLKDYLVNQGLLSPSLNSVIQERQSILIAAPTEDDIRNLIPLNSANEVSLSPFFHALWITPSSSISGLQLQYSDAGRSNYFMTNSGVLNCTGDAIIDGTLFLNHLSVNTDSHGCRLYVTGSVFISDVVNYVGPNASSGNLQISSARGIFLGMSTIAARMQYAGGLSGATTPTTNLLFNQKLIDDRDKIVGLTDDAGYFQTRSLGGVVVGYLRDMDKGGIWYPAPTTIMTQDQITNCTTCVDSTITYSGGQPDLISRAVTFKGLVLNAPVVMSRYEGEFHGSIIAEFVLFKLSNFVFFSDPTLTNVQTLPLVNSRIFSLSDH